MSKTYYKALYKAGRTLYSAIMRCADDGFEYPVGEWLERPFAKEGSDPDFGPFAVFEQLRQARLFARQYGSFNTVIYKCCIRRSKARHMWAPVHGRLPIEAAPTGTVLADAVMITEEVKEDKATSSSKKIK